MGLLPVNHSPVNSAVWLSCHVIYIWPEALNRFCIILKCKSGKDLKIGKKEKEKAFCMFSKSIILQYNLILVWIRLQTVCSSQPSKVQNTIIHLVINLPKTPEDPASVSRGFAWLARYQASLKAVGAVDGCHVRTKPPSSPESKCYRNRTQFPSIILQAVCDHQGHFFHTMVAGLSWSMILRWFRTAYCTTSQSTLIQGISFSWMSATHASNTLLQKARGSWMWKPSA